MHFLSFIIIIVKITVYHHLLIMDFELIHDSHCSPSKRTIAGFNLINWPSKFKVNVRTKPIKLYLLCWQDYSKTTYCTSSPEYKVKFSTDNLTHILYQKRLPFLQPFQLPIFFKSTYQKENFEALLQILHIRNFPLSLLYFCCLFDPVSRNSSKHGTTITFLVISPRKQQCCEVELTPTNSWAKTHSDPVTACKKDTWPTILTISSNSHASTSVWKIR